MMKFEGIKAYNFLLMIALLLASGMATKFSRSIELTLFLFTASFIYLFIKRSLLDKHYFFACAVWFLYVILSYAKYSGENYFWPFLYFCNLTIVFSIIKYYGIRFFETFTDAMYFLASWSLICYLWQIISFETMFPLWSQFDLSEGMLEKPYTYYAHTFLYTVYQFKNDSAPFVRNAGFCWEPGAFACFLVMAILLQLYQDSFLAFRNKRRYLIFLIALLSTGSTTGLIGMIVIFVGYLFNLKKNNKIIYLSVFLVVLIPFLLFGFSHFDKVKGQISANLMEQIYAADSTEHEKGLGRFQSAAVLGLDFINNPILGLGVNKSGSWIKKLGVDVSPTSGLGNMFSRFGSFLMIPFLYYLLKSSDFFSQFYKCRGKFLFFAIILVIGFSFNVIETPIFLSLILFSLFYKNNGFRKDEGLL